MKHGADLSGTIGLWVDVGTEGYFKDLKIIDFSGTASPSNKTAAAISLQHGNGAKVDGTTSLSKKYVLNGESVK